MNTRKQYEDAYRLLRETEKAYHHPAGSALNAQIRERNIRHLEEQFLDLPESIRNNAMASARAVNETPCFHTLTGWRNWGRFHKFTGGKSVTYFLAKRNRS